MVRLLSFFVLSLFASVLADVVHAQVAPTLTPGTSRDEVIRAHGWPPGRTALGTREIWSYDGFRVVLEEGRVVDVSSQTPDQARVTPPSPPRSFSPPQPRPDPAPIRPHQLRPLHPATPTPATAPARPAPPAPGATGAVSSRAAAPIQIPSPTFPPRAKAPPVPPSAAEVLRPLIIVTAGFFIVVIAAAVIRIKWRARSIDERLLSPPPPTPSARSPTTFEQHIASKLGPVVVQETPPPMVVSPPAAPAADPSVFTATLVRALEWKRFELLVTLYFGATGVNVRDTGPGADGGVDVVLTQPGEASPFAYIQCKARGSEPVGVSLIRELRGVMATDHIPQGIFATTSDYTADARAYAQKNGMTLLTTADLVERLNQLPADARHSIMSAVTAGDYTTPSCPKCERKMVWREKPQFWSCPQFMVCRSSPIYPRKAKT